MDKSTFKLEFDTDSQIAYVCKVKDEMTKNHKDTGDEITTGFMPQILTAEGKPHKMCPVHSFVNYINHLSEEISACGKHQ